VFVMDIPGRVLNPRGYERGKRRRKCLMLVLGGGGLDQFKELFEVGRDTV